MNEKNLGFDIDTAAYIDGFCPKVKRSGNDLRIKYRPKMQHFALFAVYFNGNIELRMVLYAVFWNFCILKMGFAFAVRYAEIQQLNGAGRVGGANICAIEL